MKKFIFLFQFAFIAWEFQIDAPQARAQDPVMVGVSRVDTHGDVKSLSLKGEWVWKRSDQAPCVKVVGTEPEIQSLGTCLSEASTLMPLTIKGKRLARYVFDLPFEYPVIVAEPECVRQKAMVSTEHVSRGFGIVGVRCPSPNQSQAFPSQGLSITAVPAPSPSFMNRYEVKDRSGNGIATFLVAFPTPSPTPVATPSVTPSPTPLPTPKPFVPKKGWAIGFYVGAASSSHTNVSSSGSGQSQSWKGNQLHLHGDANRLYPLIGNWYPELEFRSNQLGSIAGLTAVSGHLHWNLNKGNRALLLVGLGGNLIGMNGTSDYGIITSIAWSTHAVWRTTDRKFAIGATYGPLLSPVPGLSSTWIGLNADYRINLFHSGIHLGADVNWMTVPSSVSGVNVNYSSNSYALMMGYYFGE